LTGARTKIPSPSGSGDTRSGDQYIGAPIPNRVSIKNDEKAQEMMLISSNRMK